MRVKHYFLLACLVMASSCLLGFTKPVASAPKNQQASKVEKPKNNDVQRLLDLSLPEAPQTFADPVLEQQNPQSNAESNLFAKPVKKPSSPLQLKGGWLMSQEPEPEKRKSVDGAGISINLKP
jgi:hypothetical protein